jgi:plastocyanin
VTHRLRTAAFAAAALVAAAASLAGGAGATPQTTNPQTIYHARVVLTTAGISFKPTKVMRGALVQFRVQNASKVPQDFFIGGYLVHSLKPGGTRAFALQFLERGKYTFYSKGHPGKKISGLLAVT